MPTTRPGRPRGGRAARRRRTRRRLIVAAVVIAVALVGVVVGREVITATRNSLARPGCQIEGDGGSVARLDPEQAENASLIAAVAVRRGLPPRAAVIATATAIQESKLHNLDHGDRDSLGLFQQRPSQGWGRPDQVQDPRYATEIFYERLVDVDGYLDRPLTEVAQDVQRSGFPEAYAEHEDEATIIATALTGARPYAVSCRFREASSGSVRAAAEAVDDVLGVSSRVQGDRFVVGTDSPEGAQAVAAWSVTHAHRTGARRVSVGGRTWVPGADASEGGWTQAEPGAAPGSRRVVVEFGAGPSPTG